MTLGSTVRTIVDGMAGTAGTIPGSTVRTMAAGMASMIPGSMIPGSMILGTMEAGTAACTLAGTADGTVAGTTMDGDTSLTGDTSDMAEAPGSTGPGMPQQVRPPGPVSVPCQGLPA